jgi:hypothetical protein
VLTNPTGGYSIGHDTGTGTIVDDDAPSGYTVDVADASTWEADAGASNGVKAIVTLSQPATSTVTVVFRTVGGTASTLDYKGITKTLTFNPGDVRKPVNVKVYPDAITEPDENIGVSLSNVTGGPALGRANATLTILDDD